MTWAIDRHEKAVLQFSGGKDSTACLVMLRPYLDRITVMWANTGDAFPETIAVMDDVRRNVPNFLEVKSNVASQIAEHGWPVSVLPVTRSVIGRMMDGHEAQPMQPYTQCCYAAIWQPLQQAVLDLGATLVIRGQRLAEATKSPIRSGTVLGGIEFWFPIEAWSDEDVYRYLHAEGVLLPEHYQETRQSLDCMHCTGWLPAHRLMLKWMRAAHPELHVELRKRFIAIRGATRRALRQLDDVIEE